MQVTNLTSDWADGKAFLALVNRADPEAPDIEATDDAMENVAHAFEEAEKKYVTHQIFSRKSKNIKHHVDLPSLTLGTACQPSLTQQTQSSGGLRRR